MRRLTEGEMRLARGVFADALDYRRVRLFAWPARHIAVAFGSWIALPSGAPRDFASAPAYLQSWLIHELTHVWQFQTRPLRTLASWAATLVKGGYGPARRGYRYALPLDGWDAYNLEQQACLVEHAFMLRSTGVCPAAPEGATLDGYAACLPFAGPGPRQPSSS